MENNSVDPSPVAYSVSLYGLLLGAYPSGFRHEYGPHMVQVFRECLLRSYYHNGLPGVLSLWLLTLIDYLKSVLEEHLQRGIHMSKSTFIRLSGWALVLGAVSFMVVIVGLARDVMEYNPLRQSSPIDLYLQYATWILLPTAMFLWVVGMAGLYLRYKDEANAIVKFSLVAGMIGGVTAFLITLAWVLEITLNIGEDGFWIFAGGMSIYFIALVIFGIASIRGQLLPRWNALPIIAGSWVVILWLLSFVFSGDGSFSDPLFLGLILLSMLSLGALGYLLGSDAAEEVAMA
jgi:hypothetical protein